VLRKLNLLMKHIITRNYFTAVMYTLQSTNIPTWQGVFPIRTKLTLVTETSFI